MGDDVWHDGIQTREHQSVTQYRRGAADARIAENSATILRSLINLSIARQAEFGEPEQRVYVNLLKNLEPTRVSRACADLAREPRGEYESAMPPVGEILARCNEEIRREMLAEEAKRREHQKRLPGQKPVAPEKWAQFKSDVERHIRERKTIR